MRGTRITVLVAGAALATGSTFAGPALAGPATTDRAAAAAPVQDGLTDPFGLTQTKRLLVVTEAGAGRVRTVEKATGRMRTVVRGLGPYAAASAAKTGESFAVVTGEADPEASPGRVPSSSVLVVRPGGEPRQLADLMAHELDKNPDGQTQFEGGQPLDALSNPFGVIRDRTRRGYVLVADGGANAVLRVKRNGDVRTFFVPPTVNTGACEGLENNDEKTVGCDAVPTGLAYGPGGLYVSALTAEVPGEGRVYVVDPQTGQLRAVLVGFSGPTGVAVDKRTGEVYVSELLENAPAGPPGPGFDPSTVGRIVKASRTGKREVAQVTMPVGVVSDRGRLWSTAWSVAGLFLGESGLGRVVTVPDRRFRRLTADDRRPEPRRSSGVGDRLALRIRR